VTFLLSEDKALRDSLLGMVVHDQKADGQDVDRAVRVYFGQPDQELTPQLYPYVTIDMIDIQRDPTREMRGKTSSSYLAPADLPEGQSFEVDIPIPVNIDYQVTVFSRHPRHDRELLTQINFQKLPQRFGMLQLDDGTVRRLDVMGISKRDATEQAKRLFINAITVRVSSEVSQGIMRTLYKVQEVHLDEPNADDAGGRPGDPEFIGSGTFTTVA
jgi:hypothetical protein